MGKIVKVSGAGVHLKDIGGRVHGNMTAEVGAGFTPFKKNMVASGVTVGKLVMMKLLELNRSLLRAKKVEGICRNKEGVFDSEGVRMTLVIVDGNFQGTDAIGIKNPANATNTVELAFSLSQRSQGRKM